MIRLVFAALMIALFSSFGPGDARWTTIKGKVVDAETGQALIGAKVVLSGQNVAVYTDPEGHFEMDAPVSPDDQLHIEYIAYESMDLSALSISSEEAIQLQPR